MGKRNHSILSCDKQAALMRLRWPSLRTAMRSGTMLSRGLLKPSPLTDTYRVRFVYKDHSFPQAYVDDPEIRSLEKDVPVAHTYSKNRPCLFVPMEYEWNPAMSVASTMVPWLMEWLVFYEGWRVTGEWHGGGKHPSPSSADADEMPIRIESAGDRIRRRPEVPSKRRRHRYR